MITTTAIIATEEQAEATMQAVREGAARRKAEKAAKAARATTRAPRKSTLELARDQFDRQLAERPTGIHRNPDAKAGKQWEAYQDGRLLGGADSNFGAQAILDGVTYDELSRRNAQGMDAPAADLVVTAVVETPAGEVAVREVVLAPVSEQRVAKMADPIELSLRAWGVRRPNRQRVNQEIDSIMDALNTDMTGTWGPKVRTVITDAQREQVYQAVVALFRKPAGSWDKTTEEATMDAQTYEREVVAVEQAGTGEYAADCPECHGAGEVLAGGTMSLSGELVKVMAGCDACKGSGEASRTPKPLPICPCGATYTTHAIPGCECAAERAAVQPDIMCQKACDFCSDPAECTCTCGAAVCARHRSNHCPWSDELGAGGAEALADYHEEEIKASGEGLETPPPAPEPAARYRPFSNGSQFADWEGSNCSRCAKSTLGDDGWAINCPLLNALFEAQMDDGTISEADATGIGYLDADGQETGRYVWPCAEVEWTEAWKAACNAKREAETPPPAPSTSEPAPSCVTCEAFPCYIGTCPKCRPADPLPFTPGPADAADALAEIEAAAGVVDVEPPPSELALQFAETTRRLVEWQDAVANGGDWVAARRAHIDAMLEVERFAGLKAWPAVVGQAA